MYRENAAPSAERLEALVAEIRPMAGALADDFFELDEHRDLRPVLTEVLETEGKMLSAGELTHFLAVADQLRARLHHATANLAALRTSLDAVPEGFPPFRPSAKGFLQALFDPIFRLGDVSRVEDVKKTLRRKWNVEFASSAIVGGEEAWFEMMLPGDEGDFDSGASSREMRFVGERPTSDSSIGALSDASLPRGAGTHDRPRNCRRYFGNGQSPRRRGAAARSRSRRGQRPLGARRSGAASAPVWDRVRRHFWGHPDRRLALATTGGPPFGEPAGVFGAHHVRPRRNCV